MVTVGIDIGSTATKGALFKAGVFAAAVVTPTGWEPRNAGRQAFEALLDKTGIAEASVAAVVATGYGRISLPFADRRVTEVTCHARGAHHLLPGTRLVVDIGGQDSKVIALDGRGNVVDFIMNDKCAAGTGRFLQVMAGVLDLSLDGLGELARVSEPAAISSMCTVFAESEVIGLLARGVEKGAIAAGVVDSIARRLPTLVGRMPSAPSITFTGGLARNRAIRDSLQKHLGVPLRIPEQPQMAGAIGAALIGGDF